MKTQIQINGIVEAEAKSGKTYWKVDTNQGMMSCFEKSIIDSIGTQTNVEVDVQESKGFKNIRDISNSEAIRKTVPNTIISSGDSVDKKLTKAYDKFADARQAKNTAFYVSYSKDICIAMIEKGNLAPEDCMTAGINVVKQAIKEFS